MKLDAFLEKFDLFAEAPNAVARMRELVLQLAVQGKLVAPDVSDDPLENDGSFFKKIADREEVPPGEHFLSGIPQSWRWIRFEWLGDIFGGHTPSMNRSDYWGGTIPWVSPKDMHVSQIDGAEMHVTEKAVADTRLRRVPTGSLIFVTRSGILKRTLPVAVNSAPCVVNQDLKVITPYNAKLTSFLRLMIRGHEAMILNELVKTGMTVQSLMFNEFRKKAFPLPPLAEQKRIVAKVDELMALCDRLEAQQQERETRHAALARASLARFADDPTPANLSFLFHPSYSITPADLRKSILTLAVQGKLVTQSQDDESVVDSLIAVADVAPSEGREAGEPPFLMPSGWTWLRVADVFEVVGGIQKTPHRAPRGNAFPYLSVSNVYRGRLDLTHVKKFELEVGELERRRLEVGDLLIIEGNGSFQEIGRCASWNGEIENCAHQNHIIRCRPRDVRITPFVLLFLNSPNGVEIMQRLAITSSGLYSLSVGKIRQIEIPLPPLAEQRRIVAKVDQLMALVDQLEAQLAESKAAASRLLDAMIHELLNPRAEIIEFPRNRQNRVSDRAAIGCHIIQRMAGSPHFGKVMLMKLFYLSETHLDRSFGGTYKRHAAGPWDPWIDQFESLDQEQNWFSVIRHDTGDGHTKFEYRAGAGLGARAAEAAALLGNQQPEFDRVLGLFADKTFEQAEIIATLFAAWNDALIDGLQPTDGEIIREVRERWHPDKARFTPAQLQRWLAWMRVQKLVPKGLGRRTVQQTQLPLH